MIWGNRFNPSQIFHGGSSKSRASQGSHGTEGSGFSKLAPSSGTTASSPSAPLPPPVLPQPGLRHQYPGWCHGERMQDQITQPGRPSETRGPLKSSISGERASVLLTPNVRGAVRSATFATESFQEAQQERSAGWPRELPLARGPSLESGHPHLAFCSVSPGPLVRVAQMQHSEPHPERSLLHLGPRPC